MPVPTMPSIVERPPRRVDARDAEMGEDEQVVRRGDGVRHLVRRELYAADAGRGVHWRPGSAWDGGDMTAVGPSNATNLRNLGHHARAATRTPPPGPAAGTEGALRKSGDPRAARTAPRARRSRRRVSVRDSAATASSRCCGFDAPTIGAVIPGLGEPGERDLRARHAAASSPAPPPGRRPLSASSVPIERSADLVRLSRRLLRSSRG